jgi:hypothetical protein
MRKEMPRTATGPQVGYQYEDDLAVESAAYLDHVLPEDAVWWHTPNQGRGDGRTAADARGAMLMAAKLKAMGLRAGIPDVTILWQGRVYMTDAKSRTGALSDSQKALFPKLERAGAHIQPTYRTIEELESHLVGWGIPLRFRYTDLRDRGVMKPSEAQAMNAIALASASLKQRRAARVGRTKYGNGKLLTGGV